MARLVYGLNVSLDGYVDHDAGFAPDPVLFRHFINQVKDGPACIYGRGLYEVMRYWDADDASWGEEERAYAEAWRGMHKYVVSRSLTSVGPNATLVSGDLAAAVTQLKAELSGDVTVGGPVLAGSLTELGLIDVYMMYLQPVVLGGGRPFFTGPRTPLKLTASEQIGNALRLTYAPA